MPLLDSSESSYSFFCLHVFRRTLSCHFWRLQRPKAYPQSGVISKESVFNQVATHKKNETAFLPQTVRLYNSKFKTWCSSYTFVCNKREHHCAHMTIVILRKKAHLYILYTSYTSDTYPLSNQCKCFLPEVSHQD